MNDLTENTMSVQEARECINEINAGLMNVGDLLLDLYERRGWEVIGYTTWRECATKEFHQSQAYLYRQLEAAKTRKLISPIGEKREIPESQTRPLSGLSPEQKKEVWNKTVETAPEGKVTAKHVEEMVKGFQKVSVPKPNAPGYGLKYAQMAIMDLEKISDNDIYRDEGISMVREWIQKNERRS